MPNYKNSIVYKLCCDDTAVKEVYVGSTTDFKNRKSDHKRCCNKEGGKHYNRYVYRFIRDNGGWSNWSMVQLEAVELNTKRELHARERHWIETLGAGLNKQVPLRTDAEYYQTNREAILAQRKQYKQANREAILARDKQRYQANKEAILARDKQRYQANKEAILAQHKLYYQANKEAIAARGKLYYRANKDVKPCAICGVKFDHAISSTVKRHLKTKHHLKAMQ